MTKAELLPKIAGLLLQSGFARVHPDARETNARAAMEALAGLPSYEQLWVGDLRQGVQVVALASGERLPGVELARRAPLLAERARALSARVKGQVQVLQLVAYDRPVPRQERDFVLGKARVAGFLPFTRGKVATWILALAEPALHTARLRGWPAELGADQLRALVA